MLFYLAKPVANPDDDEPYSPGGSDDDDDITVSTSVKISETAIVKTADLDKAVDILDREIKVRQQEIASMLGKTPEEMVRSPLVIFLAKKLILFFYRTNLTHRLATQELRLRALHPSQLPSCPV